MKPNGKPNDGTAKELRPGLHDPLWPFEVLFLKIDGKIYVRDTAISQRGAAGEIGDIFDMGRPHHAGVVNRNIHE